ncbi:hypothetical protein [Novacetimonas hansenii]|uniref:hypothetical protein n=1 Tax=Novacetimonas hansenii TaxID=436 RepID=UPI00248E5531|nr:hypothetical protein [Novacetimonas hansenii]
MTSEFLRQACHGRVKGVHDVLCIAGRHDDAVVTGQDLPQSDVEITAIGRHGAWQAACPVMRDQDSLARALALCGHPATDIHPSPSFHFGKGMLDQGIEDQNIRSAKPPDRQGGVSMHWGRHP